MDTHCNPETAEQAEQADIARARWLDEEIHEIDIWCEHIGRRVREQIRKQETRTSHFVDESEILYGICVVINRLAQIDFLRHGHINDKEFGPWFAEATGWPDFVAQAFWFCVRHPTMHLGRSMLFADHGRKFGDGYRLFGDINGGWDYDELAVSGPAAENTYLPEAVRRFHSWGQGWSSELGDKVSFPNDVVDAQSIVVHFHIPGLLRILDKLRSGTLKLLQSANYEQFMKLSELNKRTGLLTAPGYVASHHLPALDLDSEWDA
ncbi:hypothetical protein AHiyo1_44060 [Arthrobacter sp. Hiyo1]|uniref:hypothetical protein n=1 Tax=Arthrobacter sp. Hiyo1 TaxID=1588020 RepID=UPI0006A355F1|nr:hypothetical protein [Arthrobacter sp. Hiyo1]GAP60813.1 hypothetical protein AHiyo1_44060 [Arthrobacter sp. Hiyo1]